MNPNNVDLKKFLEKWNEYKEFIGENIKKKKWTDIHSWSLNLAYYLYRSKMTREASYLVEGVRCSSVKYGPQDDFAKTLDGALIEIRCAFLGTTEGIITHYFRCDFEIPYYLLNEQGNRDDERNGAFFPHRIYWLQPLALVFAAADSHQSTMSKAEVDPFGTDIRKENIYWIFRNFMDSDAEYEPTSGFPFIDPPNWKD